MRNSVFHRFVLLVLALCMGNLSLIPVAQAGMIGTQALIEQQASADQSATYDIAATRQRLIDGLVDLGVDASDAYQRVNGLTEQELAYASERLNDLPAGAGAVWIIGAVFIVLLVLELVGVINIFNRI